MSLLGFLLTINHIVLLDIRIIVLLGAAVDVPLSDDVELWLRRVETASGGQVRLYHSQVCVRLEGQGSPGKHVIILQIRDNALIVKGVWGLPGVLTSQEGPPLAFDQFWTRGRVHWGKHQRGGL